MGLFLLLETKDMKWEIVRIRNKSTSRLIYVIRRKR